MRFATRPLYSPLLHLLFAFVALLPRAAPYAFKSKLFELDYCIKIDLEPLRNINPFEDLKVPEYGKKEFISALFFLKNKKKTI